MIKITTRNDDIYHAAAHNAIGKVFHSHKATHRRREKEVRIA